MAQRRLGLWRRFAVVAGQAVDRGADPRALARHGARARHGGVIIVANHISPRRPARRRRTSSTTPAAGRVPGQGQPVPGAGARLRCCAAPARSRSTAAPPTRQGAGRRGAALDDGERRRDLPRGHRHPRSRLVADAGQDRGGPAGAGHRRAVIPVAQWGPQRDARPATQEAAACCRAHADDGPRRRRRSTCPRWAGAPPTAPTARETTDEIMLRVRDQLAELRGETPPPLWTRPRATPRPADRGERDERMPA